MERQDALQRLGQAAGKRVSVPSRQARGKGDGGEVWRRGGGRLGRDQVGRRRVGGGANGHATAAAAVGGLQAGRNLG